MIANSNDEYNFPHKLLFTNTQVSRLCIINQPTNSSDDIKLPKSLLHKIGQSRGFLGRLLDQLLKTGLPFI